MSHDEAELHRKAWGARPYPESHFTVSFCSKPLRSSFSYNGTWLFDLPASNWQSLSPTVFLANVFGFIDTHILCGRSVSCYELHDELKAVWSLHMDAKDSLRHHLESLCCVIETAINERSTIESCPELMRARAYLDNKNPHAQADPGDENPEQFDEFTGPMKGGV